MSSDDRLKRLGLDHLKDDPEALKSVLDKAVKDNNRDTLNSLIEQLVDLSRVTTDPEDLEQLKDRIRRLREENFP